MSLLSIATMLVAGLILAVSAMFLAIALFSEDTAAIWGVSLTAIGMAGIVGSIVLVWSDRHGGRHGLLALGLTVVYCGFSFSPPFVVATDRFHGVLALFLIALAICNLAKHRLKS